MPTGVNPARRSAASTDAASAGYKERSAVALEDPDAVVLRGRPLDRTPGQGHAAVERQRVHSPRGRRVDGVHVPLGARLVVHVPLHGHALVRGEDEQAVARLGPTGDVGHRRPEVLGTAEGVPLRHTESREPDEDDQQRGPERGRTATGEGRQPFDAERDEQDRRRQADHQVADHEQRPVHEREHHDGGHRHHEPARREAQWPLAREELADVSPASRQHDDHDDRDGGDQHHQVEQGMRDG